MYVCMCVCVCVCVCMYDINYLQQYKFADFDTVQLKVNTIHCNLGYNVSHYHYGLVG